jgi:hypothetical protein
MKNNILSQLGFTYKTIEEISEYQTNYIDVVIPEKYKHQVISALKLMLEHNELFVLESRETNFSSNGLSEKDVDEIINQVEQQIETDINSQYRFVIEKIVDDENTVQVTWLNLCLYLKGRSGRCYYFVTHIN